MPGKAKEENVRVGAKDREKNSGDKKNNFLEINFENKFAFLERLRIFLCL